MSHPTGNYGFEDDQPVPVVMPDYGDEPEAEAAPLDAEETVRGAVMWLLYGGHRDAIAVRVAALARILGTVKSDRAAGRAAGVDRTTLNRAKRRLRAALVQQGFLPKTQARRGHDT